MGICITMAWNDRIAGAEEHAGRPEQGQHEARRQVPRQAQRRAGNHLQVLLVDRNYRVFTTTSLFRRPINKGHHFILDRL